MDVHGTYRIMDIHALNKSQLNFTLEHYWVTRLDLFVKKSFLDLERAQNKCFGLQRPLGFGLGARSGFPKFGSYLVGLLNISI